MYDWSWSSVDEQGNRYEDGKNRYHVHLFNEDSEIIQTVATYTSKRKAIAEVAHLNRTCATCDYPTCKVNGRCCLD